MSDRQNLQAIATALEHLSSDIALMDGLITANDQFNPEHIEHARELAVRIEDTADRVHNIPSFLGRTPCNGQELLTHGFRNWPYGFEEQHGTEQSKTHDDPRADFELMDLDEAAKRDIKMLHGAFTNFRLCARELLQALSVGIDDATDLNGDVPEARVPNGMWTTTKNGRLIRKPSVVIEEARSWASAVEGRCHRLVSAYVPANQKKLGDAQMAKS